MHSIFADDVRYLGEDDSEDDFGLIPIALFSGECPVCRSSVHASTTRMGSGCKCKDVSWHLNVTVTTDDLPPFAWSISMIRTRALRIVAETAGTRQGKVAREMLQRLMKDFGKKAVDDAIKRADCGIDSGVAVLALQRDGSVAEPRRKRRKKASRGVSWHSGQRPITGPNPLRAAIQKGGIDPADEAARFYGTCPTCSGDFVITSTTRLANCRCDSVSWRLNIAITTHDFPPHSWHPETIRKRAMQALQYGMLWRQCPASQAMWEKLEAEFSRRAVYASVIEV